MLLFACTSSFVGVFDIIVNELKFFFIFIIYIFTFVDRLITAYFLGLRVAGPQLVVVVPVSGRLLAFQTNGSRSCSVVVAVAVFGRAAVMEVSKMWVPMPAEFYHRSF